MANTRSRRSPKKNTSAADVVKVLLISPAGATGGAEAYMVALGKHLITKGLSVHACVDERESLDGFAGNLAKCGISVIRLPIAWEWNDKPTEERLRAQFLATLKAFQLVQPNVAFLNLNWLDAGTGLCAAAAIAGIPTVALFHLCPNTISLSPPEKRLFQQAKGAGQQWFTVSADNRLYVSRTTGISTSEVGVIYNGPLIDPNYDISSSTARYNIQVSLRAELGLPVGTDIIATVGRHDIQKGLPDILPILPGLLATYPNSHYLWIGDGPLRQQMERVVAKFDPTRRRVTFWPHRTDVQRCLAGSDIFLFPTRFEGFSLALLEAMHVGCCPVVSNVSSVPEIVEDDVSGYILRQGDIGGIRRALGRLLDDKNLRAKISRGAQAAARKFPAEKMFEEMEIAILKDIRHSGLDLIDSDRAVEQLENIMNG